MEVTPEIQEFVLIYLQEHPRCTAREVGVALNSKFPELPATRKTGNQVLYRMEKLSKKVVCDRSETKPRWSLYKE